LSFRETHHETHLSLHDVEHKYTRNVPVDI
jgi:hypothetical protein